MAAPSWLLFLFLIFQQKLIGGQRDLLLLLRIKYVIYIIGLSNHTYCIIIIIIELFARCLLRTISKYNCII